MDKKVYLMAVVHEMLTNNESVAVKEIPFTGVIPREGESLIFNPKEEDSIIMLDVQDVRHYLDNGNICIITDAIFTQENLDVLINEAGFTVMLHDDFQKTIKSLS